MNHKREPIFLRDMIALIILMTYDNDMYSLSYQSVSHTQWQPAHSGSEWGARGEGGRVVSLSGAASRARLLPERDSTSTRPPLTRREHIQRATFISIPITRHSQTPANRYREITATATDLIYTNRCVDLLESFVVFLSVM